LIGAKTVMTLAMLAVGSVVAYFSGFMKPERLLGLPAETAFLIGCLATVMGALLFRACRFSQPSVHYFRFVWQQSAWQDEVLLSGGKRGLAVGRSGDGASGEAFELGPRWQLGICIAVALLLCCGTLDARGVRLLGGLRQTLGNAGASYCPEPSIVVDLPNDPNAPGCALIRRAHELGYAKSLGDCGAAGPTREAMVCTRRQRDEPLFHYGYRLLGRAVERWRVRRESRALWATSRDLQQRLDHVEMLSGLQRQVIASTPHASHHIFTNLPDPDQGTFAARTQTCTDRYRQLPPRPVATGPRAPSRIFQHVLAQLLFEPRYEPAAGYCREYHVHWGAPPDACQQLARSPEAFLGAWGALQPVREALARHRLAGELEAEGQASGTAHPPPRGRALTPPAFISFHCYMEGGSLQRASRDFVLDGQAFSAQELLVPAADRRSLHIDRYTHVAGLLAPSFHYGALLSEAGIDVRSASAMAGAFVGHDFLLSRVQSLANLDLFLEPEWIAGRADLLEVYPYHLHLQNYVHLFRRHYLREHGRP
jgi:hypothetical protein